MKRYTTTQLYVLEKATVKCSDVNRLLREYTDNELPISLRSRVDHHLHSCEECSAEFDSYQFVVSAAKMIREETPHLPHAVRNRLHAALNARLGISLPVSE